MSDPAGLPSGHDALDALAEDFLTRRRGGEEVSVESFAAAHPEQAAEIRDLFPTLVRLEEAAGGGSSAAPASVGPYRIVRELGRGGMGIVYLAQDERVDRRVALKVLRGGSISSVMLLRRFQREAEIASRLDHPGICKVFEAGEADGLAYIAMQFVAGETLAQWVKRRRAANAPISKDGVATVLRWIEEAARALHVAHEAGLIHRDVKPANVMIDAQGLPFVLDFGLARLAEDPAGTVLTQTGAMMGTPAYMSPEQILAERCRLDRRTDVYSLGVTLYECLTLKLPFAAPTPSNLYQEILSTQPESPRRLNPSVGDDLCVVVEKAMDRDREQRYATAADLAEDLRRVREHEPIRARPKGVGLRMRRWTKRHPVLATSAAGLLAALATGLVVWFYLVDQVTGGNTAQTDAPRRSGVEAVETAARTGRIDEPPRARSEAPAAVASGVAIDLGGGVTMPFVLVPAGSFQMGSDAGEAGAKPVHTVTIAKPFYLATTEVTQAQWKAVMNTRPSLYEGADRPVETVSWDECQDFLTTLSGRARGARFTLPSEAQWEYACRAGSTTKWCFGDDESRLGEYAWCGANVGAMGTTHPVHEKKPNAWGLFDMHGNVWEWCKDRWHKDYVGAPADGSAWDTGTGTRVTRSGAFYVSALPITRSAFRNTPPTVRGSTVGFRPALEATLAVDLGGGVTMSFILVPAGSFRMGSDGGGPSETPVHTVTIAQPYYLAATEVTQAQWRAVMGTNPSKSLGDDLPVESVSWDDCQEFLTALHAKVGGERFALPSESQWEYACQAGATTKWCFGDDEARLADYAWYGKNSGAKRHPAGTKKPNAWGLFDMHGNVLEWCDDVWRENFDGAPTDGSARKHEDVPHRVYRGGCWHAEAAGTRSACRTGCWLRDVGSPNLGLRPVRTVGTIVTPR